jgi:hypothetical protein
MAKCYAAHMDPTPWGLILVMFAYAFVGWSALFAIHYHIRKRRTQAPTARHAAMGYGDSWKTSRASEI